MHYYQFNIGDYKSHTEHLSEIEDLAYRRLLDWYYLHERPIPVDIGECSRQIRMRTHTECIATVLHEFFEFTENGWIHHRANRELEKAGEKSSKAAESAKKRWEKHANALPSQSECNATHNTLPITQDTLHSTVPNGPGGKQKKPVRHEKDSALQDACRETWVKYSAAYKGRYRTDPVRNAKVNSQIRQFCKALPLEEAPEVAAFFLSHSDHFYARKMHDVGLMLADAAKLRTEWATGTIAKSAAVVESFRERDARLAAERMAEFAPGVAARPRKQVFDLEAQNDNPIEGNRQIV